MINKFGQFKTNRMTPISAVLLSVFASTGTALAAEGELFSLAQQPSMLFDGEGGGTLTGSVNGVPYEIIQGHAIAQGDMVLGRLFADGRLEIPGQARAIGQSGAIERWPDGIVPYQFADGATQIQRDRAQEAIAHWNARTSIKLVSRQADNEADYDDYITFEPSNGCASWVGRTGGEQAVWLGDTCTVGSIIHEIGHAIGLFHEHTRPDRDDYVTVNLDNVSSGKEINFEKIEVGAENYSPYDFGSIMHYGEYFFSSNSQRSISVPDGVEVGQREALSEHDANGVDVMYATDLKLDVTTTAADENTRIDILVSNIGPLGSNTLKLTASLPDDADWLSISANSGWDCQQFSNELRCTRATLAERKDSSFSILADPKSSSIDALKVRVESRTLDTELNNNVLNDVVPVATTETQDSEPAELATDQADLTPTTGASNVEPTATESDNGDAAIVPTVTTVDSTNNPPAVGAANSGVPIAETNSEPATGSTGTSSSGGGAGVYLFFLMLFGRFTQIVLRKSS